MRYELKGYRIRRVYQISHESIISLIIGSTAVALILALPTFALLIAIYRISGDIVIAASASVSVHYLVLLLLIRMGSRMLYVLGLHGDEGCDERG